MLLQRQSYLAKINELFEAHPIVVILGPRQCGKTTLARMFGSDKTPTTYLDLEDPTDLVRLDNPKLALEELTGLVVIDEVQNVPNLFPVLRVLVDRANNQAKFLILGSASRDLIRQSSETLAGRAGYLNLAPFSLGEVSTAELKKLWVRGGFPRSFLAESDRNSKMWRQSYVSSFLKRDIPALGISIPAESLRRFWLMIAHCHGQVLNYSELGRSFGIADTTAKRYIDILTGTFMIRQLAPWHENISKRQVKSPKLYFRDSGIFHHFLGVSSAHDLETHPKLGASWEGFALEEVIRHRFAESEDCFFWATHASAELDLLLISDGLRNGYEFKFTDAPKLTRSMQIAKSDLKLDSLTVVFPGKGSFPLAEGIRAYGLETIVSEGFE